MLYKVTYFVIASVLSYVAIVFTFGIETTHNFVKQTMKDFSKK